MIKKLEKSDWEVVAKVAKEFSKDPDWVIEVLKKPFVFVYAFGEKSGLILAPKILQILYIEGEEDTIGNLQVFYNCMPYCEEAIVEYINELPGIFTAFKKDRIKPFNISEELNNGKSDIQSTGSSTASTTPSTEASTSGDFATELSCSIPD